MEKYSEIYESKIRPLYDLIRTQLAEVGRKIFKYKSKIKFADLFYVMLCANSSNTASYSNALSKARKNEFIEAVTKCAILKKRKQINSSHFTRRNL